MYNSNQQQHFPFWSLFFRHSAAPLVVFLFALLLALTSGQQNAYSPGPVLSAPSAPIYGPPAKATSVPAYPPLAATVGPQYVPSQPPFRETSYGGCAAAGGEGVECPAVEKESFPVPICYLNKDGFMCCNKELENLMVGNSAEWDNTYRNISRSRGGKWKRCNLHQVAVATQRNAEKHFGVDFETVVGAGDFAAKNYFNQDLDHFGLCVARLSDRKKMRPMLKRH